MSKIEPRTAYSPTSTAVSLRVKPWRWSSAIRLSRPISSPGFSSRTALRTRNGLSARCVTAATVVNSNWSDAFPSCSRCSAANRRAPMPGAGPARS